MSLVTVSEKKGGRVYQRKFDHDLARELHAAGESYAAIGRQLDVTSTAVQRVCDPEFAARGDARAVQWMRDNKREPCLGGCGRLVWTTVKDRSGYCHVCMATVKAADDVRPHELRCKRCGEWKPDDAFRVDKDAKTAARRRRYSQCRDCTAAVRRDHRHRNREASRAYDRNRRRKGDVTAVSQYTVLQQQAEGEWAEIGETSASSPVQAAERLADGAGTYVAFAQAHIIDIQALTVLKGVSRKNGRA